MKIFIVRGLADDVAGSNYGSNQNDEVASGPVLMATLCFTSRLVKRLSKLMRLQPWIPLSSTSPSGDHDLNILMLPVRQDRVTFEEDREGDGHVAILVQNTAPRIYKRFVFKIVNFH